MAEEPLTYADVVADLTPPASYATVEDLERRLGGDPLNETGQARGEALLRDASTIIRTVAGRPFTDPIPDVVQTVCLNMAVRAWHNPEGIRQETTGSYNVTYAATQGGVTITDEERRLIRIAAGHGAALDSIQLTTGNDVSAGTFAPVAGGGDWLPWP